mmetsp:Transcript_57067/g.133034  ORF Transcript_57067/g.133034 Transcript_57067/m.133034 type:complete len:303 (+) Transcript_57067:209-1117(+)
MKGDSTSSPMPGRTVSASPSEPCSAACRSSCREVSLTAFAGMHISSPSESEEAGGGLPVDSASTCASSDAGDTETQSLTEDKAATRSGDEAEAEPRRVEEEPGRQLLVTALAKVLVHLAALGCRPQRATCFHAVSPPPNLPAYLERIARYYHCSDQCLVLGLVYIDRLVNLHAEFVVSPLNIHRLLAVSVMVAAKFWDDVFYSNDHYASVAGVRTAEINFLEVQFLKLVGWRLMVQREEYSVYLDQILRAVRATGALAAPASPNPGAASTSQSTRCTRPSGGAPVRRRGVSATPGKASAEKG